MPSSAIDPALAATIVNPLAYAAGDAVDAAFRAIRADAPFGVAEPEGYDPFWVVSRHADILAVEKQGEIFRNGDRSTFLSPRESEVMVKMITGGEPNLIRSLVSVDGQEHKDLRGIIFPAVTPRALKGIEEEIRAIARHFVAQMLAHDGRCDFAADVAFLYPLRVIMSVLGVPPEDEPFMLRLSQELFSSADPELNRDGREVSPAEALMSLKATADELEAYFGEVTRRYRAEPTGHLNSLIANARINGDYLNQRQLMGYYIIAATAGHDTTSNTTAGAMWAMAEDKSVFRGLAEDMARIPAFVEESIRWVVPVKHFMRTAAADVEVAGQQVKAGDWLMLAYQSANRDEAVFEEPFRFRLDREPNRQVAFGYGPHVCLGQHLARMEMRVLWEELLPHLAKVDLDGPPERTISNFVCGPKHVPIRFVTN